MPARTIGPNWASRVTPAMSSSPARDHRLDEEAAYGRGAIRFEPGSELEELARGRANRVVARQVEPDGPDVALVSQPDGVELEDDDSSQLAGRRNGRIGVPGDAGRHDRDAGGREELEALPLGQRDRAVGAGQTGAGGRVDVMAPRRPVRGQRGPARPGRAVVEAPRAHGLPRGNGRDRAERLERPAEDRHAASLGQLERRLRRRFARRQRDVDGQELGPIRRRPDELLRHLVRGLDFRRQRSVREVVDDREYVVGAGTGERTERGGICRRRIRGAPRIERVADVAECWQVAQEPGARLLGDGRQVDAGPRGEIGDQRCLTGRDGHDARPPAADGPPKTATAGNELGGLEELVQVVAADHAGGPERSVRGPILARERPGMSDGGGLGLRAPADLDDHDRLAELESPIGERQEPLGSLEALHEQDHRLRLRVVEAVGEEVAGIQHDLTAATDDPREADPGPGVDERVGHRTGLGDAGDAATRQPRVDVADVRCRVRREVDHAHAVGAEQRNPVADRDLTDVALHLGRRLAALDDTAARDDHARDPGPGGLFGDGCRAERIDCYEDGVRALRQCVERRIARLAVELLVARIDEVTAGVAAHDREVVPDRFRDAASRRGPDDGDGTRCKQRAEVDRSRRHSPDDPRHATLLECPGDDQALDLRRPLPDPIDPQLAEEPLGRVLAHVAAATEHLDDAVSAAEGCLGGEQLGERRLRVDDLRVRTGVRQPGRLAGEQPRRGRVGGRVGQRERHALEVVDPLAELDPPGRPLDGERQQPLHRPAAARPDVDPLLDEPLVREGVRLPHPAENRRRGHADVGEDELWVAVGERVHVFGSLFIVTPGVS